MRRFRNELAGFVCRPVEREGDTLEDARGGEQTGSGGCSVVLGGRGALRLSAALLPPAGRTAEPQPTRPLT